MEDDKEERLSFSDVQFFSDNLQLDSKLSAADGKQNSFSSPSSSSNHDFLGFFSAEWSDFPTSISSNAPDDIIFCGKVIYTSKSNQTLNPKKKTDSENKTDSKNNKSSIMGRNSNSFSSFSNGHSSLSTSRLNSFPILWRKKKDNKRNDVLLQRTTKLACPSKSRWQVFMFGSGRFPMKMELSDIRSRQKRRSHSGEEEKIGGKQLSGLIRVLGCGGGFTD
ncbi:unnamed protein product [Lactuca saligna]|uniref:Uncharacterized protein n=1 Tax=Lactuca saligna TaxID=75948 RepID=A0AA35YGF9_LACSI|nr:unnamed protein product [Lactuca saligna]